MDYKDSVFEVYIHESSCVSVSVHVLQKMQWNENVNSQILILVHKLAGFIQSSSVHAKLYLHCWKCNMAFVFDMYFSKRNQLYVLW